LPFRRRIYSSPARFWADLGDLLRQRHGIRRLMQERPISPAFRERLMLAVTQVNDCRYCAYFHAQQALLTGLSDPEIRALQDGILDHSPAEELPALLYAQHWAEADGHPDPRVRARVLDIYGADTLEAIELSMRLIRMGNLTGNTWDYLLYRVTLGHCGQTRRERLRLHPAA
jgi:AhpD family alkylhydroperoxidase